jgi:hypothetical protein
MPGKVWNGWGIGTCAKLTLETKPSALNILELWSELGKFEGPIDHPVGLRG